MLEAFRRQCLPALDLNERNNVIAYSYYIDLSASTPEVLLDDIPAVGDKKIRGALFAAPALVEGCNQPPSCATSSLGSTALAMKTLFWS